MLQTSYSESMPIGIEGALNRFEDVLVDSKFADVDMPAGRFVVRGADVNVGCKLPTASTDLVLAKNLGITVLNQSSEIDGYKSLDVVSVIKKGEIMVTVEDAVTAGADVYVRHTAGAGALTVGRFRSDADTNKAVKVDGCRFLKSAGAGELTIIQINIEA
jgi:hypothetical protein